MTTDRYRIQFPPETAICPACRAEFVGFDNLAKHIALDILLGGQCRHDDPPYSCFCGDWFNTIWELANHLQKIGNENLEAHYVIEMLGRGNP